MRVKGGFVSRRRHKKVLERASGYRSLNGRAFTIAIEKNDKALTHAYKHRKARKRDFRALWTVRINAAARLNGTTYARFMGALRKAGLDLNRKMLAELAVNDAAGFSAVVKKVAPLLQA